MLPIPALHLRPRPNLVAINDLDMPFIRFTVLLLSLSGFSACTFAQTTTTMPDATSTKTITLSDSVSIAYTDAGRGDNALVFIHGLGSNRKAWRKNVAELSKSFRCLTVDLPGYGDSSKEDYPFSIGFFADQVDAMIQALELKIVTLVGHSMGGQVAITLALRQPDYLSNLILAAPAGLETFSASDHNFFATYVRPDIIRATPVAQIEQNFAVNFYAMPNDARFMVEDRMTLREDTAAYRYYSEMIPACVTGMLAEPVADRLPELNVPTLIVFGKADQLIPNRFLHPELSVTAVAQGGAAAIPNAQLVLLAEAGHFVQWEQAKAFNAAVKEFLP